GGEISGGAHGGYSCMIGVLSVDLDNSPQVASLRRLVRLRWRMGIAVSTFVALVYFGFILLIALFRATLSVLITEGLSVGVALGAGVIVITWAATWFYVRWKIGRASCRERVYM